MSSAVEVNSGASIIESKEHEEIEESNDANPTDDIEQVEDACESIEDETQVNSTNPKSPVNNNPTHCKKVDDDDDDGVLTITANDGSLGQGHVIAPKPPMPKSQPIDVSDDDVELIEDGEDSNDIQELTNGDDEDVLLADEDSSVDNRVQYNELDSSNDVDSNSKNKSSENEEVLLLSDDDANSNSVNSSIHTKTNASKEQSSKDQDDDVMEIEETDPLGDCEEAVSCDESSQDETQKSESSAPQENSNDNKEDNTIVVNDTKSLVELANSKKEPGKEPTLVIIDTNAILAGKGPVPLSKSTPPKPAKPAGIDIPDDAYLIEAPSFIVPYVFEQSGEKALKDYVKELADKVKEEKEAKVAKGEEVTAEDEIAEPKKTISDNYFESPVGKMLINIGMNLVQEFVQVDLLKMQKRQGEKEKAKSRMGQMTHLTQQSIISLKKNIEESKENNEPFKSKTKKCELCNFKTESDLVMSTHQETPHMKNYSYRCNFCTYTTRVPQEILFHMEAEHAVKGKLERAPAYHQCPNCPFEDNSKAKLTRHLIGCTKRFTITSNLIPPMDWDTPAKLPKLPKNKMLPQGINPAFLVPGAQNRMSNFSSILPKHMQQPSVRGNLPPLLHAPKSKPIPGLIRTTNPRAPVINPSLQRVMMKGGLQQPNLNINNNQMLQQVVSGQLLGAAQQGAAGGFLTKLGLQPQGPVPSVPKNTPGIRASIKPSNQPSISITPLPRQTTPSTSTVLPQQKPGGGKTSFVICEICDGYIKDLDQLRNHMQWIHKVKIHPKMIYNKPPLNCQKCQFRFFTDQGLERHLLGSHGLVTSSMQEAANKGQDGGRCPLCGKVYQWKLLAHVAKDHNVTLKPAHLSYKCTVCTATFGMYKLFESHVYSAHSVTKNAPRPDRRQVPPPMSGKMGSLQVSPRTMPSASQNSNFKPLKINDEITIIPQPMANSSAQRNKGSLTITPQNLSRRNIRGNEDDGVQIIEIDDAPYKNGRSNGDLNLKARFPVSTNEALRKRNIEISLCSDSDNSDDPRGPTVKRLRQN